MGHIFNDPEEFNCSHIGPEESFRPSVSKFGNITMKSARGTNIDKGELVANDFRPKDDILSAMDGIQDKIRSYIIEFQNRVEAKKIEAVFKVLEQILNRKPTPDDIDAIRLLVCEGKPNEAQVCYGNIPLGVLSWGFDSPEYEVQIRPDIWAKGHTNFSINFTPHK